MSSQKNGVLVPYLASMMQGVEINSREAMTAGNHDPPLCVWEQLTGSRKAGTSIVQGFKPALPFSVRFQWCAQSVSHLFHGPAPR